MSNVLIAIRFNTEEGNPVICNQFHEKETECKTLRQVLRFKTLKMK